METPPLISSTPPNPFKEPYFVLRQKPHPDPHSAPQRPQTLPPDPPQNPIMTPIPTPLLSAPSPHL